MYQNEIVKIIQYLTLFELDVNTPISEEIINREFKRLAKIYHPDVANTRYKDGKKFIELKEAKDYLLSNIDKVNRLITRGFGGSSYSYEEERRYREEAAKRAAEEEIRRQREEAARRAAEEERIRREEAARRAAEEERRRRETAARKAAEERAKIEREKKKIEAELKALVDNLDKEAYFESDYEEIVKLITSFINKLHSISNYNHEYFEILNQIKSIKTINEIKKIKFIKKTCLISSCFISLLVICILLITNLIIPSIRYSNAIECIYNQEYNNAENIFKDLDGFKDSDLQLELIDVYKLLNNNQYVEAIELFEKKNGKVNIEYNPNGGEILEKIRTSTNSQFKTCNKKGYNFIRYVVENYEVNTKKELVLDIKLKAIYEIIQYNISYDLNDGVLKSSNPDTYNVLSNDFNFSSPVKEGYNFIGWFDKEKEVISIKKGTVGNLLLTAKYEPISYNIVYNLNGGINSDDNLLEYNIESNNIVINSPQKPGYSFIGWTVNGDEKVYNEFQINSGSIGDVELIAYWKANDYKITYELNGGINNLTNPDGYVTNNGEIIIKDAIKDGYSFVGWISNENSSPIKNYIINDGEYGNIKLTAIFTPNKYEISFDLNGSDNSFVDSLSVTFDSEYKLNQPTRTAYEFVAWEYNNSDFNLNGVYNISENITLVAIWKPINYKITYDLNNGANAVNNPESYNTEESIELLSPSRVGYNFIGWSTEENQVPNLNYTIPLNSYGDLTIIANFEPKKFKITYNVNNGNQLSNNEQLVEYDSVFDTIIPTRVGYTFDCWNLNNKKFDMNEWNLLEDIELVAAWKANVYDVEIIDEVSNTFKVTYDSHFNIENQLKDNYIFKGYYSEPYGKGSQYTDENGYSKNLYKDTNNIKLYPYYQYKVDFITNGGNEIQSLIYDENVMLSSTIITEKNDRTFDGWYTDIDLTKKFEKVIGNVKVYAKWLEETNVSLFEYEIDSRVKILKYNGIVEHIIIPTHIGGVQVTELTSFLFGDNIFVKSILIPYGIDLIPYQMCFGCLNLETVSIPNSVLKIEFGAFDYCSNIKEIVIPDSVEEIGSHILTGCDNLEKLTIPFIGKNVYDGSYESGNIGYVTSSQVLKEIILTKSLYFGTGTFKCLTSLESIQLPETHYSISSNCFFGCKNLKNINLPSSITSISQYAFAGCSSLEEIIIPAGVKSLEEFSFAGCEQLKYVYILGDSISLGSGVFTDCQIEKIESPLQTTFLSNSGERFESPFNHTVKEFILTFGNLNENKGSILPTCEKIFIPDNIKGYCGNVINAIKEISIPNLEIFNNVLNGGANTVIIRNLDSLASSNFGDFSVKTIVLPNNILNIEGNPFKNLSKLEEIVIENEKYKTIDGVLYTSNLKTLVAYPRGKQDSVYEINSQTRTINFDSFGSNIYLNNIIVPDEIEVFDESFDLIHNLNGNIKDNLKYIGSYNNPYLILMESLKDSGSGEISDSTKFIYKYCFENKFFDSITLPASISHIAYNAFLNCDELDDVYFKGTLEDWCKISFGGPYANPMYYAEHFYLLDENLNYYEVTEIEIPSTIKRVNEYTFNGFNYLEKMIVPNSVEYISYRAFYNCDNLNSISIPFIGSGPNDEVNTSLGYLFGKYPQFLDEVYVTNSTKIYNNAFKDLISVRKIEFTQYVDLLADYSFYNCYNLETLNVNFSVNSVGNYSFYNCNSLKKIEFDENLNTVGDYSFANCYSIEELNLYNSNQYGISAFDSCKSLKYFYGSCLSGKNSMFFNCHSLIFISIKDYQSVQYKPGVYPKALFMLFSFDKSSDSNLWNLQGLEYRHGGVDGHFIYGYVPKSLKFLKIEYLPTGKYGYYLDTQPYDICSCEIEYIIIEKDMILEKHYWTNINTEILFEGNMNDWNGQLKVQPTYRGEYVSYDKNNIYFYSEEQPLDVGRYWRYVDGIPVIWS